MKKIIKWIPSCFFIFMMIIGGVSVVPFGLAAVMLMPIPKIRELKQQFRIGPKLTVLFAFVLLIAGSLLASPSEPAPSDSGTLPMVTDATEVATEEVTTEVPETETPTEAVTIEVIPETSEISEPEEFEKPSVPSFVDFTDGYAVNSRTEDKETHTYYRHTWNFDRTAMEEYAELLERSGFTLLEHWHDDKSDDYDDYVFDYNGPEKVSHFEKPDACKRLSSEGSLYISVLHISSQNATFDIFMSQDLHFGGTDERTSVDLTQSKKGRVKTTAELLAEERAPKFPDFAAFTNNCGYENSKEEQDDYTKYDYFWNYDEKALREYISLLENKYDLKLRKEKIEKRDSWYVFDYTGEGEVKAFDAPYNFIKRQTNGGVVYIWESHYGNGEVQISVGEGIAMADKGDRTSVDLIPREGGNSASDGESYIDGNASSSNGNAAKVSCPFCDSDGKVSCSACGGDGGKYVEKGSTANYSGKKGGSKTTRVWEKCISCHGTGKRSCPKCGGDHIL